MARPAASGVLYYGLAFWFYLSGLRHAPASVAGLFITLVPVFGVAAGYLVGERLSARQWVGAVVVIAAVAAVAIRQTTPDQAGLNQDTLTSSEVDEPLPSAVVRGVRKPSR